MIGWRVSIVAPLMALFLLVDALLSHPFWAASAPDFHGQWLPRAAVHDSDQCSGSSGSRMEFAGKPKFVSKPGRLMCSLFDYQ
jgi:hypothetical protein